MGFRLWLALAALVIAAGIVVPYFVLSGGPPSLDIFVFWCLFGAAVVAVVVAGVLRWRA